jgi:membrane fusion protein, multidrug efflux system
MTREQQSSETERAAPVRVRPAGEQPPEDLNGHELVGDEKATANLLRDLTARTRERFRAIIRELQMEKLDEPVSHPDGQLAHVKEQTAGRNEQVAHRGETSGEHGTASAPALESTATLESEVAGPVASGEFTRAAKDEDEKQPFVIAENPKTDPGLERADEPSSTAEGPRIPQRAAQLRAHVVYEKARTLIRAKPKLSLVVVAVVIIGAASAAAATILEGPLKVAVYVAGPATVHSEPGGVGTTIAAPNRELSVGFDLIGVNEPVTVTSVSVIEGSRVRPGQPLLSLDPVVLEQDQRQIALTLAGDQSSLYAAEHATGGTSAAAAYLAVEIPTLRGKVALDQELLQIAKGNTATITAPVAGTVTNLNVEAGQVVRTGATLMQIVDTSVFDVMASVQLADLPTIRPGDRVDVAPSALPGVHLRGTVLTVSPSATAGGLEGTIVVEARNLPGDAVPLGTEVFIHVYAPRQAAVAVPALAVSNEDLAPAVFIVRDHHILVRRVTLGAADGKMVQILAGLRAGEEVAISNMQDLTNGTEVRVTSVVR